MIKLTMTIHDLEQNYKNEMRKVTLCFLLRGDEILMGYKKVRFGAGKYNGFGGKLEPGETLEQALIREIEEEIFIKAKTIKKVGVINFYFPFVGGDFEDKDNNKKYSWDQQMHAYFCTEWEGEPKESDEIRPEWMKQSEIPYGKMWSDDLFWLPHALFGKFINASFMFGKKQEVADYKMQISDILI